MISRLSAVLLALVASLALGSSVRGQDACDADVTGDGAVDATDLSTVLADWGLCKGCSGDITGDNRVDAIDLAVILGRWGGTCSPVVYSLSPNAGRLAGGETVTISGEHLLNPLAVTFGGTSSAVLASSRNSITVLTPARQPGAASVVLTTRGGAVSAGEFQYFGAPTIGGVSPNIGAAAGGSTVSIIGTDFYGTPIVTFGGAPSASVYVVSPTLLIAISPPGTSGSSVAVTVATGSGLAVRQDAFAYVTAVVPGWATLIEEQPDPTVVTNPTLRERILATGYAWRVRHTQTQIEMVLIPPGNFNMGCSASNSAACQSHENPIHMVTLTDAYYLGRYEVRQSEWQAAMGSNPSQFQGASYPDAPNRPVERVSWNMIQLFSTFTGLRLPTEAEWEYAYRAGTSSAFHSFAGYPNGTSNDSLVGNIAWFAVGPTHPVGQKLANALGLHDMAGNVWEWVSDWYSSAYYQSSPSTNPTGPSAGSLRVLRGGSWVHGTDYCRASHREVSAPGIFYNDFGFRVARNP